LRGKAVTVFMLAIFHHEAPPRSGLQVEVTARPFLFAAS
jgi:hypothetical protein